MSLGFKVSKFGWLVHSTVWQYSNSAASGHCNRKQAAPGEAAGGNGCYTFVDLIGLMHIQERVEERFDGQLQYTRSARTKCH